jgi:choline dehydrogenase-like flavoprotein
MLKDLHETAEQHHPVETDVVVVGAGIAGLVLATRLARSGVRTIVVESGPENHTPGPDPLNEVVQAGQLYNGAEYGRFRGLGGTSRRWGGAMLPFLPCDMEPHTAKWAIHWPTTFGQLDSKFAELERMFQLPAGPFEADGHCSSEAAAPSFNLRSAKFPSFQLRNVATALREDIDSRNIEIWVNATVTEFRLNEHGRLAGISAVSPSGASLSVQARFVIVAAGAIESTRLLLLLDAQNGNRIFQPDGQLGRYFYDHLAAPAAIIHPTDRVSLNETFGMRFVRSGMRDLRIEPSRELRTRLGLPGAFAHVRAVSDGDNAFAALRAIYQSRQSRSAFQSRHLTQLARDLGWLVQATHWRFVKRRLLAPRNSSFELTLVIEQFPDAGNTISLARDRHDRYGMPLAKIAWQTNPRDRETFDALQSALTAYWNDSRFAAMGTLQPMPAQVSQQRSQRYSDFFHPGGTTRMGRDAAEGVVDADLRTYRIDNLYVVSTSTFPSGGGSSPTFMLMAFALRAAEHIARRVERANP